LKEAFSREWVAQLGEDIARLYEEALKRPGGAIGRGPNRHYVEIHPEDIRGFVDLVTHPWVTSVGEAVLGPDYKIVEIGWPWTLQRHRITSVTIYKSQKVFTPVYQMT